MANPVLCICLDCGGEFYAVEEGEFFDATICIYCGSLFIRKKEETNG